MLTRFDDYPLHQTAEPLAQPSTGDRNFYDRYFFSGYSAAGDLFFAAALGVYPNRRVMDAAFSVVRGGTQWVVRASRLAPLERTETTVGPITVEVVEPLRTLRLRVADNDYGVAANLTFAARTAPIAWAASSTIATPRDSASFSSRGMSAQRPNRCTGTMARLRGPSAASTAAGSIAKLPGSMSAKTGRAPARRIASTVAK